MCRRACVWPVCLRLLLDHTLCSQCGLTLLDPFCNWLTNRLRRRHWLLGMIWFGHLWKVTHHAPSSSSVQVMIECLGHYVCHHFLCRTHVHYDVSLGNMISNVMISNINVPGFLMICLVLRPGSGGRVVLEQNNWLLACLFEFS